MDLTTFANCPLCAAVIIIVSVLGPKLAPRLGPFFAKLLDAFKGKTPTPAPSPPPGPTPTGRPLLDLVFPLLLDVARKRFPFLTDEQAVQRLAIQEVSSQYYRDDSEREAAAATSTRG